MPFVPIRFVTDFDVNSPMFFRTSSLLAASFPVFFLFGANCAAAQIRFEVVDIDPRIGEVCYAVTAADVDGDGLQDLFLTQPM